MVSPKEHEPLTQDNLAAICRFDERRETDINPLILNYLDAQASLADARLQRRLLRELVRKYVDLEKRVAKLLRNTLPASVAEEIQFLGRFAPRPYDCTIMFLDIAGFTHLAERMSGASLIDLLDALYRGFDDLVGKYEGTKVKTIGDAYMVVFGAPEPYGDHAARAVSAAAEMLSFLGEFRRRHGQDLEMRVGIHTGRVMAGVVGKERMQFDVFGDDVNIASRFESSGAKGRINCSEATYLKTKERFSYEARGEIALKNKGHMKAYFVLEGKQAS